MGGIQVETLFSSQHLSKRRSRALSGLPAAFRHHPVLDVALTILSDKAPAGRMLPYLSLQLVPCMLEPPTLLGILPDRMVSSRVVILVDPCVGYSSRIRGLEGVASETGPDARSYLVTVRTFMRSVLIHGQVALELKRTVTALELVKRHLNLLLSDLFELVVPAHSHRSRREVEVTEDKVDGAGPELTRGRSRITRC